MAAGKNKPRAGTMSVYPRVRARKSIPKFNSFGVVEDLKIDGCKPLCYFAYKAGMTYVIAKNAKQKSAGYGQKISVPVTVLETPDIKIVGARFYKSKKVVSGKSAVFEFSNLDKELLKRIKGKKSTKKKNLEDYLKRKDEADSLVLLGKLDPSQVKIGSKKASLVEIPLSGTYEEQLKFLEDNYNKKISVNNTFDKDTYLDVKAISIGHGFTGPVKRFGIKVQRPKHKTKRHVGSISPWHPATVMFTVPRPGQHGYHNRTTFNKKLVLLDSDVSKINPKSGFKNYGNVNTKYILIAGNTPGPTKRVVTLRRAIRKQKRSLEISDIEYISQ